MKLHWSLSNLIIGIIAMSMLSTASALAKIRPPFSCYTCCPDGPLCDDNNDTKYKTAVYHSIDYTNQQVGGQLLSSAQWQDLANRLSAWKDEADHDHTMYAIDLFFWNNRVFLEAPTFNAQALIPAMRSVTSTFHGTWDQMAWAMNKLTQAQRIAMVNYVRKYGYDGVVTYAIAQAQAIAKAIESREPFDMCGAVEGGAYWFGFMAAGAALIGQEEAAVPLAFIGATFALGGYMGGCY